MRRAITWSTLALVVGSVATVSADPKEDITSAAKKLGEKGNYAWTATVEGGFSSVTEGKTDKGVVLVSITRGDNTLEAVLHDGKGAVKTPEGWRTLQELADSQEGDQGRRFLARRFQSYKAPAADVADLVAKAKELKQVDGVFASDLTEDGAKELLTFRRGGANAPQATVTNPKGSVKIWVKDGVLTKYEVHVEGSVEFNGNTRDVDRTTTVEIKDVGSAKVEVPEEAKQKLT